MGDDAAKRAWERRRTAAKKHRANRIRLLLIADGPPADPESYFYFETATASDPLYDAVVEVFFEDAPRVPRVTYLKELKRRGVFVVELRPDAPLAPGEPLAPYAPWLPLAISPLAPEKIVIVGADVAKAAADTLEKEGLPLVDVVVPAPAAGDPAASRRELRRALVKAELETLIRPLPVPKKKKSADASVEAPEE